MSLRTFYDFSIANLKRCEPTSIILDKELKNSGSWRILIDGGFVVTRSGKTFWNNISYAKNALRFHFKRAKRQSINERAAHGVSLDEAVKLFEESYQAFIKDRVTFVDVCSTKISLINAYIYDNTGKSKDRIKITTILSELNEYLFVLLENNNIGLVNKRTKAFISDKYQFYCAEFV